MDDLEEKKRTPAHRRGSEATDKNVAKDWNVKFSEIARLVSRDLNNLKNAPKFYKYTKDEIATYLKDPYRYEVQIRNAVNYIYVVSPHFRRLIQYFVSLTNLSYIISPYKIDPRKQNAKTMGNNYRKTMNFLQSMNIKTQIPKVLTVCFREDVCYLTTWVNGESITLQQLPSDYCAISSIENNVFNVTFNFQYFDINQDLLKFYPKEFELKYNEYRSGKSGRWIELNSPTSFAVKLNDDIQEYAIPPFAGLLRDIYDIEDYRTLKLSKTALENYALLVMQLPMDDEGNYLIDYKKAKEFWFNLDTELPEEVGSVLTPMPINKIGFEKSNTGDVDRVSEAEENMFTEAGVQSLLFNNDKASANALLLSVKVDQAWTYKVVCSIADAINRILHAQGFGKNFNVNFLNVSEFNKKEAGESYLKAATYGLPTISAYGASQGISQSEIDSMSFLETTVLGLQDMFKPIINSREDDSGSSQTNNSDVGNVSGTGDVGAPKKDIGEVSDKREENEEGE